MRYTRAALQQQLSRILLSVRPPDDERFAHIYATSRAELLDYITHLTDEDDSVLIKRLPAASRLQFHTSGAKLAARNEYLRVLQPLQDYFSEFVAVAIGARAQSAKTYLEKHHKTFKDTPVEELCTHALQALACVEINRCALVLAQTRPRPPSDPRDRIQRATPRSDRERPRIEVLFPRRHWPGASPATRNSTRRRRRSPSSRPTASRA